VAQYATGLQQHHRRVDNVLQNVVGVNPID
jgi:hypothetical protein